MKNAYLIIALLVFGALFQSCEQDVIPGTNDQLVAPELPSAATYAMPTDALRQGDTTASQVHGATYRNWVHASLNLVVWHTAIALNGAVPFAAFAYALNQEPQYIGNGVFEWSYEYRAEDLGGQTYHVSLTAEYVNNGEAVQWIMTVSEVGGFTEFEWYRGVVSRDETEAHFVLNHQPNNPEPFISIDYHGDPQTGDGVVRYTNIRPSDDDRGGYIEYREDASADFNRAFDVKGGLANPNYFLQIQWNEPTHEGRVKNQHFFHDNNWHCWDQNLADTDC
ncbi:MAG: hypothetical protein D6730_17460 [Bacteroidetes bacterium]|nr:MAG: hypothetical protein D6730_17460 [Bacteroidota bacterium]